MVTIQFLDDTTDEQIDGVVASLAALEEKIDVIKTIQVGRDARDGHRTEVGLTVDTVDLDALDSYRVHPEHRKIVDEMIKPHLATITGVDIEI